MSGSKARRGGSASISTADTLSYLPGRVATEDEPFTDPQVTTAGRPVRAFHDATRGSALAGQQETVCHGDAERTTWSLAEPTCRTR
jgi:hypothetical protein